MTDDRDYGFNLDALREEQAREVVRALYMVGEDLAGRAGRLAPIEEGTLRASAAVVLIVNGARYEGSGSLEAAQAAAAARSKAGSDWTVDVEVSFNTIYAARQHEETEWHHPLGGQAKYLEQPFREQQDRYIRIVTLAAGGPRTGGGASPDIPF